MLIAIAAACAKSDERDESCFVHLPNQGWLYGDTVTLSFVATESVPNLAIRHRDSYPYRNLWLELTRQLDSATYIVDTLNIELCNAYGRWHGNGFGGSYQFKFPLSESMRVSPITVRHIMRVDTLRGIEDIGIVP